MNYSHAEGDEDAAQGNDGRQPSRSGGAARRARPARPERVETFVRNERKVGRNEPCPCGSGKKYKHCCGRAGSPNVASAAG